MPILGRPVYGRFATALLVALLVGALVPTSAHAEDPVAEVINVTGRGWGHGRGLGQWGAFGYATGRSGGPWSYRTILDHFYGDTEVGAIGDPLVAVNLLAQRGASLSVERAAGVSVAGLPGTSTAVRVTLRSDGRFDLERSSACVGAPWAEPTMVEGPVRLQAAGASGAASDTLRLCRPDGSQVGYRGELVLLGRSFDGGDVGLAQTVNLVRLDDLLRSVLPGEVPPAWVTVDDGRGMQAVLAQAVAARGFTAAGDGRWLDLHSGLGAQFTTCDSSACQAYAGVSAENPLTDEAVTRTSGEVRMRDGAVIRTEFSASSGGWTAGGAFPAVPDQGDAVLDNPYRVWGTQIRRADIEDRYALGSLQAIEILERNGFGSDGGRVLQMRLVGTARSIELTGTRFRADFALRSDWFTLKGTPPRPPVDPRPVDDSCPVGSVPASPYTDVAVSNQHRFSIDCVAWWEVMRGTSPSTFAPTLSITRAQMAAVVARLITATGGELPADPPDAFADDDGNAHEGAINALAALGIVLGVSDERFVPGRPVERAQVAALLTRAVNEIGVVMPSDPPDAFADDAGSIHESAINALAAEGILTGVSAGYLQPHSAARRDQIATLLARSLDLIVEQTGSSLP